MRKKLTTEEFVSKAKLVHGNKYDYSLVDHKRNRDKIKIICKKHGEFSQTPGNHLTGYGCSKCGGTQKLTTNEFIEKSKRIHGNKYDYSNSVYTNNVNKISIICLKHGEFFQMPASHLNGNGCTICGNNTSYLELDFLNYCKIPNTKNNRQVYINPYKVDGINNKNTIYEFLGNYWHGNPKRHNPSHINKTCKTTFGELYKKTFEKLDFLKKLGYTIKYIWESDWRNFKNGIDKKPKILTH